MSNGKNELRKDDEISLQQKWQQCLQKNHFRNDWSKVDIIMSITQSSSKPHAKNEQLSKFEKRIYALSGKCFKMGDKRWMIKNKPIAFLHLHDEYLDWTFCKFENNNDAKLAEQRFDECMKKVPSWMHKMFFILKFGNNECQKIWKEMVAQNVLNGWKQEWCLFFHVTDSYLLLLWTKYENNEKGTWDILFDSA